MSADNDSHGLLAGILHFSTSSISSNSSSDRIVIVFPASAAAHEDLDAVVVHVVNQDG